MANRLQWRCAGCMRSRMRAHGPTRIQRAAPCFLWEPCASPSSTHLKGWCVPLRHNTRAVYSPSPDGGDHKVMRTTLNPWNNGSGGNDATTIAFPNETVKGGVEVVKTDDDLHGSQPQGDASLDGTVYEIVNKSNGAGSCGRQGDSRDAVVATIATKTVQGEQCGCNGDETPAIRHLSDSRTQCCGRLPPGWVRQDLPDSRRQHDRAVHARRQWRRREHGHDPRSGCECQRCAARWAPIAQSGS